MNFSLSYAGRSRVRQSSCGQRILEFAPNLSGDKVALQALLREPVRFREAISTLHDVVINDQAFPSRDTSAYEERKGQQGLSGFTVRHEKMEAARGTVAAGFSPQPSAELKERHRLAWDRYWIARSQLNARLRERSTTLWRRLMPYNPLITVADGVVFFECFSGDESSYGCLTVDRDSCFAQSQDSCLGTTSVDYSWDLYHSLQSLRTYRETRFDINPAGFPGQAGECSERREETGELPDGWLRGFMQLQAAMMMPLKKVTLGVDAMYSLLAWLKRHREKHGPHAIRFELHDGKPPRLVLEPWNVSIESPSTVYHGAPVEPLRIQGRRRLMSLARLLPLATQVDVYLLGTGLPSFWVLQMGNMRLTIGLSGWTAEDWTRGSLVDMLMPQTAPSLTQVTSAAEHLSQQRVLTLNTLSADLKCTTEDAAAVMNQLALRGQAIFDLHAGVFRWRPILPMALSDREVGLPHPELAAAQQIVAAGKVQVETRLEARHGGSIIKGKVESQSCEVQIDGDGLVRQGRCRCSWHFRFGVRNGPCRHLQALRSFVCLFSE